MRLFASVIIVPAVCLSLLAVSRVAAQDAQTVRIDGKVSCAECTIETRLVAALRAPQTADGIWLLSRVAQNSKGQFFVVSALGNRILVFDRTGAFVRQFGSTGDGPGEFRSISDMEVGPGDSLYVFETARAGSVFDASLKFARSIPLPGRLRMAVPLEGGMILFDGTVIAPGTTQHPVHLMDARGTVVRSFGAGERNLSRSTLADRLWMTPINAYVLERWTTAGTLDLRYEVTSPWYKPWTTQNDWLDGKNRRPSSISSVRDDSAGLLWVSLVTAPEKWKPNPAISRSLRDPAALARAVERAIELSATRIEVIDLTTRQVVASKEFPPSSLLDAQTIARARADTTDEVVIEIFHARLTRRP